MIGVFFPGPTLQRTPKSAQPARQVWRINAQTALACTSTDQPGVDDEQVSTGECRPRVRRVATEPVVEIRRWWRVAWQRSAARR